MVRVLPLTAADAGTLCGSADMSILVFLLG